MWIQVRLFASLPHMCTNLWQPVTVAFLFLSRDLFSFSSDSEKTATTEATSSFLDLVLSLQDSDKYIYFYISVE